MKVTFETKGEGENKTTMCSIEFELSGKSIEKAAQKIKSVLDNISDLDEGETKQKEGGCSNGSKKES